jgi:hypothetical protein
VWLTYYYDIVPHIIELQPYNVDDGQKEKHAACDKFVHAYTYIMDVANSQLVDRTALLGHENDIYLPYRRKAYFYGEYDHYCERNHIPLWQRGREATFRRAFKKVKANMLQQSNKNLKLSGGKGMMHFHVDVFLL